MTTGQNMPPGWYADPWAPSGIAGVWRYWDGAQWTGRTTIATTPQAAPPTAVRPEAPTAPDGRPLADWWQRLLGYLIDTLVFLPLGMVLAFWLVLRLLEDPALKDAFTTTGGAMTAAQEQALTDATREVISAATPLWLLMVVLIAVYWVVCIGRWGRTIGGAAMGIRAVTATGAVPGMWAATKRYAVILGCSLAGTVLSFVPVVGGLLGTLGSVLVIVCFLSMTWNPRRQAWQDLAAGTYVVRYRQR